MDRYILAGLKYQSSSGETVSLDDAPCHIDSSTLLDYAWTTSGASSPMRDGMRITYAGRKSSERQLKLIIYTQSREELNQAVNRIVSMAERDISSLSPSRLWLGEQYLECYISAIQVKPYPDWVSRTDITLNIIAENPCWITERTFSFAIAENTDTTGKKYPAKYPRRYPLGARTASLCNSACAPCPMRIVIYGAAENPRIAVAGRTIGLDVSLGENEYAVIDQFKRKIYKVDSSGASTNIFNRRMKNGNVFEYAPIGTAYISCPDSLRVDVTLLEQRSEPLWS